LRSILLLSALPLAQPQALGDCPLRPAYSENRNHKTSRIWRIDSFSAGIPSPRCWAKGQAYPRLRTLGDAPHLNHDPGSDDHDRPESVIAFHWIERSSSAGIRDHVRPERAGAMDLPHSNACFFVSLSGADRRRRKPRPERPGGRGAPPRTRRHRYPCAFAHEATIAPGITG
jgi:hypothetical protein